MAIAGVKAAATGCGVPREGTRNVSIRIMISKAENPLLNIGCCCNIIFPLLSTLEIHLQNGAVTDNL